MGVHEWMLWDGFRAANIALTLWLLGLIALIMWRRHTGALTRTVRSSSWASSVSYILLLVFVIVGSVQLFGSPGGPRIAIVTAALGFGIKGALDSANYQFTARPPWRRHR